MHQFLPHPGVVVQTENNCEKYLIHSTPQTGITFTDAPLSKNWKPDGRPIDLTKKQTIDDVMKSCNGVEINLYHMLLMVHVLELLTVLQIH
jgi:hypothetical protein